MKNLSIKIMSLIIAIMIILTNTIISWCWQGDIGYDTGISAGQIPVKTAVEYKETLFITGKPIELSGTLTMKKSLKKGTGTASEVLSTVYSCYLTSGDNSASLKRTLTLATSNEKKDNGQIIQTTELTGKPTETITANGKSYFLDSMEFSGSGLIDPKPAVEYFTGDFMWEKIYKDGTAAQAKASVVSNVYKIVAKATGNFTGINGYWGSAETVKYNINLSSETNSVKNTDKWGGNVSVKSSLSKMYDFIYQENEPLAISFEGGYALNQNTKAVLEYDSKLPEFDLHGLATYNVKETKKTFTIDPFPTTKRLKVVKSASIKGHWAQEDIEKLLSLGVINYDMDLYDPEDFVSRAEFVSALVKAVPEVPKDLVYLKGAKTATIQNKKGKVPPSIFTDVMNDYIYKDSIETAFNRSMVSGVGNGLFKPDDILTFADAITILIRTLGLEQISKWPGNFTTFKDNDKIPVYARGTILAANKIGLIKGDTDGNIRADEKITNARCAVIISKFIDFLRDNLVSEYTEKILNY